MISIGKQESWLHNRECQIVEVRGALQRAEATILFYRRMWSASSVSDHVSIAILLCIFAMPARGNSQSSQIASYSTIPDPLPEKIRLVDGNDIRFKRLSASTSLSQTRVAWVVQDKVGFLWFGTQYGLNRFDGYKSKVFKHEPGRTDSLSCVYVRSLFVDRAGTLWVGCDRFLDRFDPATETFKHYRIYAETSSGLPTPIERIQEDHQGVLWLATAKGLYRFDPSSGRSTRYSHDPDDPSSIAERASMLRRRIEKGGCGWQAPTGWTSWTPGPERWCAVPRIITRSANFTKMNPVSCGWREGIHRARLRVGTCKPIGLSVIPSITPRGESHSKPSFPK